MDSTNDGTANAFDLATLTWGDHFTLATSDGEQEYTVLVIYAADDDPSIDVVCLKGRYDLTEKDLSAGEEVYLSLTDTGDGGYDFYELEGDERAEVEQDFRFYFLLIGATRVTTSEQPTQRENDQWVFPIDGKNILCRRVLRAQFGVIGESVAEVFMGGEELPEDAKASEVFLIFVEVLETDPLLYGPIDEEDRNTLHHGLMGAMGYTEPEEEEEEPDEGDSTYS